jgi:hypothetical protein
MASYLWQCGGTWYFQLRSPIDSQLLLGATPIRVRLPFRTHREASRCARRLAGLAERWLTTMRYRGFKRLVVLGDRSSLEGIDGTRNRAIKSRESQRIFALHHRFRELGFIDWVETQRQLGHDYLFPDLHATKRPHACGVQKISAAV